MNTRISASHWTCRTLIDLLRQRANLQPEERIYTFLTDGEGEKETFNYAELDRQARTISAALQKTVAPGERALLVYPSGLDFIAAFFGCLYSGIIAVPVYPPTAARSDRTLSKFRAIARDAEPEAILTASTFHSKVEGLLAQSPELQTAHLFMTDQLSHDGATQWREPALSGDALAFLQYTSGSTGTPKGVMVSHSNLLSNSAMVERYCEHPDHAHSVTWLPLYHDLGLIGGILQPLFSGFPSTIMTPAAFLQRPIRWLEAVSRYRATYSGGPNFAYDLCARKITEEQKAGLDLSSWEIVANGAEPVRADTMERFSAAFARCGFRRPYFYPCYGLAESTLLVSAGKKGVFPTIKTFKAEALELNQVHEATADERTTRALVSIGTNYEDQKILIVDPETLRACPPDRVGEIWAAGPSVAQGYWHRAEQTAQTFQAHLADTGEGPFLRTGDLGFRHNGELFITGRLKDVIIIRGSNHYPQDIELTVEQCHPALRSPGGCAAFSIEAGGEERLVVVQEIERQYLSKNLDEVIAAMRRVIAEQHDLQVYALVLIKPASLPKTSSGKVQRSGTREAYKEGTLAVVREWKLELDSQARAQEDETTLVSVHSVQETAPVQPEPVVQPVPEVSPVLSAATPEGLSGKSVSEIRAWLVEHVAAELKVDPRKFDVRAPFAQYGMDSAQAMMLSADLEDWLQCTLSPALLFDYPTIEALATHLGKRELVEEPPTSTIFARTQSAEPETDEQAIAIIGLGCRFPGADSPETFWQQLREGVDGISEVPANRWDLHQYYTPDQAVPGKMNTRWGGFVEGVDYFDPSFFGISPREASRMDPQQRLLLEVAWETLENAGIAPESITGSQTGVFIGISSNDYAHLQYQDPRFIDAYAGTGNAHSIAANRLSYVLDLRGPSLAVDTACSSSLVAVHQACQALRTGECDLALAGGVNLTLTPDLTITFSQARMMSADGRCKTFDEAADGYVRGEGCGLVLLKPLAEARRAGDPVLAVIRGSAVNQDGRSNGLTAPNGPSQEAVIRRALQVAKVTPDQISYVETHGSSTPLGDPIEVEALKAVLMQGRQLEQVCLLGSVKTNIGHLEAAAGIAGLIKTVLSLHKNEIPPHLHFKTLNPHISFANTTFAIPTERRAWPSAARRLAGVSAFGFGGTNAHIILEAAPASVPATTTVERSAHVLALSAQTSTALTTLARRYIDFLERFPAATVADICHTASRGRAHFAHRLAVVAASPDELRERLASFVAEDRPVQVMRGQVRHGKQPGLAFLFTGQGSQYVQMAQQLYETQPTFRAALERCDTILRAYLDRPLLSILYPEPGQAIQLDETAYTQPALFALEYALAEMWRSWGIEPDSVMGHSVGEYVAACIAGALRLEDGLKLIAARGRLMQALPQEGDMVVVFAEPDQIMSTLEPYRDRVAVAALNGPSNTVLSGERTALQTIVGQLEQVGLKTHPMSVSHAFHSPLIEPMLDDFERVAREIHYTPLRIPLASNLTGQILSAGEMLDARYWREQTRNAVRFADGVRALAEQGYQNFLEIGPQAVLVGMGKKCLTAETEAVWLPSLRKGQDNWRTLLQSLAGLYIQGRDIHWAGFDQDYVRRRVALPTYPFEREYCWFTAETLENQKNSHHPGTGVSTMPRSLVPESKAEKRHPLLNEHMALVYPAATHIWETAINTDSFTYLNDHRIQGAVAVPVSVYIEMAQAASREALGPGNYTFSDLELKKLLLLPEKGTQKVQVVLSTEADERTAFHVYSHAAGAPDQPRNSWTLHATGKVRLRHN